MFPISVLESFKIVVHREGVLVVSYAVLGQDVPQLDICDRAGCHRTILSQGNNFDTFLSLCSCWSGITQVSYPCSNTQSIQQQWKPSPGLLISMACWHLGVALRTAASASGTRWPGSHCSAQTQARRSATWPGPNTPMNWYVVTPDMRHRITQNSWES